MTKFRAIEVKKTEAGQEVAFVDLTEADLMEGDVTVAVEHSTVNYKDGLAITGKGPIIRKFPLIPGIDFAGQCRRLDQSRMEARRSRRAQWLGRRRNSSWRLCRARACAGRLAGARAREHDDRRCHGDRHRRLYRDALRHGARA